MLKEKLNSMGCCKFGKHLCADEFSTNNETVWKGDEF